MTFKKMFAESRVSDIFYQDTREKQKQILCRPRTWNNQLTRPCFHLHQHWRGAEIRPARGPGRPGADLCSQNSPAGPEEESTGSHPPPAAR